MWKIQLPDKPPASQEGFREDILLLHKTHNKDKFNQHNYILFQNNICLHKMLHVLTLTGHHQARINKKEGNQIP